MINTKLNRKQGFFSNKRGKIFMYINVIIFLLNSNIFASDSYNYLWRSKNLGAGEAIGEGLGKSVQVMMIVTISSLFVSSATSLIINEVGYKKTKRKSSFWGTLCFSVLGGVIGATPFYFAGKSSDQDAQRFYSNLGVVTLPLGIVGGAFAGYFIFLEDKPKEEHANSLQINFVFEKYFNSDFVLEHVPKPFFSYTLLRDDYKLTPKSGIILR